MNDGYGSRKFLLAMAGLATSTLLVWLGKISGGDYVTLNSVLGGAYMLTNAYITRTSGILGIKQNEKNSS